MVKRAARRARARRRDDGVGVRWLTARFLPPEAVQYRQLADIAGNPEIKQRMLEMGAHYEAKADETSSGTIVPEPISSSGEWQ